MTHSRGFLHTYQVFLRERNKKVSVFVLVFDFSSYLCSPNSGLRAVLPTLFETKTNKKQTKKIKK